MRAKLQILVVVGATIFLVAESYSQSPAPTTVQSATSTVPAVAVTRSNDLQATIKQLEELKTANEDTLKRQEATLAALDELQKTAEQIKIFSKRG